MGAEESPCEEAWILNNISQKDVKQENWTHRAEQY